MAMTEDMTVFFDPDVFAVSCTFSPSVGVTLTANVLFDQPTNELFDDVLTNEYAITYHVGDLAGLKSGSAVTVAGVAYKVRDVRALGDGEIYVAKLSKV